MDIHARVLEVLSQTGHCEWPTLATLRDLFARNDYPMEQQRGICACPDWRVRVTLAEETPHPGILEILAGDKDYWIRLKVTRRSDIPPAMLAHMAKDDDENVVWGCLSNPILAYDVGWVRSYLDVRVMP